MIGMLWRTLESYDIDPRRAIGKGLYRPGGESGTSGRVPQKSYAEALAKAVSLIADPAIGLRSAGYLHPSHLGALGHAWMASSSLRTAILRSQRFHQMLSDDIVMQVSDESGVLKVSYQKRFQSSTLDQEADSHLASLLNLCRLNYGQSLKPAFVRFQHGQPEDPQPWHDYFGVEVQFDQAENSLAIRNKDADTSLTVSNPMLVFLNEDIMRRQVSDLNRKDVLNRTRVTIMEQLPSGDVNEASVAEALNMTKRTLHRKLAEHGLSFRKLLIDVRQELVQCYIKEPAYSITEISFLLGYFDTSAFSRAFRSWFGQSPTEARESYVTAMN